MHTRSPLRCTRPIHCPSYSRHHIVEYIFPTVSVLYINASIFITIIYTIILLVCQCSQTASRNSCSIVSGDVFVSSDSTSSHEFARQFGLEFFLYARNTQNLGETGPPVPVFISMASNQLLSPAELAVTVGWLRPIE